MERKTNHLPAYGLCALCQIQTPSDQMVELCNMVKSLGFKMTFEQNMPSTA